MIPRPTLARAKFLHMVLKSDTQDFRVCVPKEQKYLTQMAEQLKTIRIFQVPVLGLNPLSEQTEIALEKPD